uniref:Uncharacterized protein n=1 Tax=Avena sativa TaxID=4498 RepID=A0ACD5YCC3_AVESA
MMSPLPGLLQLLLLLLTTASSASFTCTKPSTCQPAVGYVVPNVTTYEQLVSHFHPTTLHDLLAANQLRPSETAAKQAIPARTTLRIPFRCRCTGNGVGQSDLYTVQTGDDDMEIITANNILAAEYNELLVHAARLPCSCDKVDDCDVMHFAYIVRSGENTSEIASRHGVPESMLLRINNITNNNSLRQGQILDIPLQGMGTWSRVHYVSRYRTRSLAGGNLLPEVVGPVLKSTRQQAAKSTPQQAGVLEEITNAWRGAWRDSVYFRFFVLVLAAIIISVLCKTWYYWRSALKSLSSGTTNGVMQFDYRDLAHATDRFSNNSKIGEGKFGAVYKATFNGQELAVKKMIGEGETKDIHDELQTVGNTRHTNLVRLKGWCGRVRLIDATSIWKREIKVELLLVFELVPNGNLEEHLYNRPQVLSWEKRFKIVKGLGSALRYLHHECNPCILHRDIKPGNILLDHHFNAKLADFGLSLIACQNRASVVTTSAGTRAYMDPRLRRHGNVEFNREMDIYSFGLVLLETACTEKTMANQGSKLREKVWELYCGSAEPQVEAAADARLRGVFDRKQMERVVVLGLKCSHPEESQRPSMEDAMKFLEDGHNTSHVP